jgi:hypothetical protein
MNEIPNKVLSDDDIYAIIRADPELLLVSKRSIRRIERIVLSKASEHINKEKAE